LTQLARGHRRKADFGAAEQVLNQKLEIAKQSNNQSAIADVDFEIGLLRFDEEKYPAALEKYDSALKVYQSVNDQFRISFTNTNRAKTLVRLGRLDEARQRLEELFQTTTQMKGNYLQLVPELHLIKAELSFSEGKLEQATESATEALRTVPRRSDVQIETKYFLGLVKASSGGRQEAKQLCGEAIAVSSNSGNFGLHSRALLRCAEAALKANDAQTALTLATQAQERFTRSEQRESEWIAWAITSRASQQLGDKNKAEETLKNALNVRSRLEQQWGPEVFKQYAARPDIQVYFR
jgi:tetratricopeptide (TPR) repeat protein